MKIIQNSFVAIVTFFISFFAFAQANDSNEKPDDVPAFLVEVITVTDTELCTVYGNALNGRFDFRNLVVEEKKYMELLNFEMKNRKLKVNKNKILAKQVAIGDSKCQVFATVGSGIGEPLNVNKTYVKGSIREQYVMKNNIYLYFDNGILSASQINN